MLKELTPGWILISFDNSNEKINCGGIELLLDTSFQETQNAQTIGTVVKIAPIYFNLKSSNSHPYDVPMELEIGDKIIFHFNTIAMAKKEGRWFEEKGVQYAYIRYENLFCALRGDKVIPLNGFIFVAPNEKELPNTIFEIPDIAKGDSEIMGVVKYAGSPVDRYKDFPDIGGDPEVNVGNEVLFNKIESIPLQYALHSLLGNLYRMHRKDVYGIFQKN